MAVGVTVGAACQVCRCWLLEVQELVFFRAILGNRGWKPGDKCFIFSFPRWICLRYISESFLEGPKGSSITAPMKGVNLITCLCVGFPLSLIPWPLTPVLGVHLPKEQTAYKVCLRLSFEEACPKTHCVHRPLLPSAEACNFSLNSVLLLLEHL